MPSFDIVSEVDMHELNNALDQANREVGTRFDFKGVEAVFSLSSDSNITVSAESDFQIQQMMEILRSKLVKRSIDIKSLKEGDIQLVGKKASMEVNVQQGIEADLARKIVKTVKEAKMKVQTAIQGEKLRVTGKKRDDLQQVMALLKDANLGVPLQYDNYRD
ncbi:MAG: YajQ family cyclic di-GMP-binding protein [Pseudohongiella sp.]|jgi:cyclic-di-GMP-binding protein|nr:YajQ family cyclic di-GMP-binding protein [Pseudohongiella sp.]